MSVQGKKPKRPGRPAANPAEGVKSKVITMRTTPETHERLRAAADAKGLSLTEWLIGLGLRAAAKQRK
jgi:predicted HicB family RNase H-like nuclease